MPTVTTVMTIGTYNDNPTTDAQVVTSELKGSKVYMSS